MLLTENRAKIRREWEIVVDSTKMVMLPSRQPPRVKEEEGEEAEAPEEVASFVASGEEEEEKVPAPGGQRRRGEKRGKPPWFVDAPRDRRASSLWGLQYS